MTLIAGIVSRRGRAVPDSARASLRRLISRDPADEARVFEDERSCLLKVDVGAYGEPGVKVDAGRAVTLLAGEPLLGARPGREGDLNLIHEACLLGDTEVLGKARGVFCAAHYQPATGALTLIADKLCLRPLYYHLGEEYVVFASALRVIEGLGEARKRMDVRAVTEIAGLGYPLASRTPYADTFLPEAAEVVRIAGPEVTRLRYWRWDEIEPSGEPEEKILRDLYDRFEESVARRNRDDTTTVAYLSGGLDSRCVVAALRSLGVRVHTFNFARPRTQDQIFGLEFARRAGSVHSEIPKEAGDHVPDYSSLMARVWAESPHRVEHPAERPGIVWSGEGGSVALGHVHVGEEIVGLMRAGRVEAAVEEFVRREYVYVSPNLFRPEVFAGLDGVINRGVREELEKLSAADPARGFHLFLLVNDQRRKLARHFENIDLHRLEFQLPFFDSDFLESIVAAPLDLCLRHRLYVRWLAQFHSSVTSVPWQSYPGHEPCPLPAPEGLAYQWAADYQAAERAALRKRLRRQLSELLGAADFPDPLLNKRNLRLASWIHKAGLRDYEHVIEAARTYHTYWKKCEGQYALPAAG
jgi:asparagine synthase (glutamine-hydrolysing)